MKQCEHKYTETYNIYGKKGKEFEVEYCRDCNKIINRNEIDYVKEVEIMQFKKDEKIEDIEEQITKKLGFFGVRNVDANVSTDLDTYSYVIRADIPELFYDYGYHKIRGDLKSVLEKINL